MSIKRVYVRRANGWWSLSITEWAAFVDEIVADGQEHYRGFTLRAINMLKRRPSVVLSNGEHYYTHTSTIRVVDVTDWEFQHWTEEKNR